MKTRLAAAAPPLCPRYIGARSYHWRRGVAIAVPQASSAPDSPPSWRAPPAPTWQDAWRRDPSSREAVEALRLRLRAAVDADPALAACVDPALLTSSDPDALSDRVVALANLLDHGAPLRLVAALDRDPSLLALAPAAVARRLVALKRLLPRADVSAILALPRALPMLLGAGAGDDARSDAAVEGALRTMLRIMPGASVEEELGQGGAAWRTFLEVFGAQARREGGLGAMQTPRANIGGRRRSRGERRGEPGPAAGKLDSGRT